MKTRAFSRLLLLAAITFPLAAHAHDPWEALGVFHNPAAPQRMALQTNRGMLFSEDGGESWTLVCRNVLGRPIPVPALPAREVIMFGHFDGFFETDQHACGFREAPKPPFVGKFVTDIQHHPTRAGEWLATTARGGGVINGVSRSTDDGQTWQALGPQQPIFFNTVRFSGDGQRIVVGTTEYIEATDSVAYAVRHSDDDGLSWTERAIIPESDDFDLMLLGVDPVDPDRYFVGVIACPENSRCVDPEVGQKPDRVMVSDDAGMSWHTLIEVGELGGFAINADHIWVGDWEGGLWRMARDGSSPTLLEAPRKPACLALRGDELLICGGEVSDQYLLARSTDNGDHFEPVATPQRITGAPVCDGPSSRGIDYTPICAAEWRDLCTTDQVFENVPMRPPECGPGAPADAGITEPSPPASDGCGCTVIGATSPARPTTVGVLWLLGLLLCARSLRHTRRST